MPKLEEDIKFGLTVQQRAGLAEFFAGALMGLLLIWVMTRLLYGFSYQTWDAHRLACVEMKLDYTEAGDSCVVRPWEKLGR